MSMIPWTYCHNPNCERPVIVLVEEDGDPDRKIIRAIYKRRHDPLSEYIWYLYSPEEREWKPKGTTKIKAWVYEDEII